MFSVSLQIYWSLLCFFLGRSIGKIIDVQYSEQEGKPKLRRIPQKFKILFAFSSRDTVVAEGIVSHILGYAFAVLELIAGIMFVITEWNVFLTLSEWLLYAFVFVLVFIVMLPMAVRYERNIQIFYDYDWVTYFQRNFSLLPKRRCKVISQIDSSSYEITLGYFGRKKRKAQADVSVPVGAFLYAVHSCDGGSPFWTIRLH